VKKRLSFGNARMARVELPVPYQGKKIVLGQVEPGGACGPTGPKVTVRLCQKRTRAPLSEAMTNSSAVCDFTRQMGNADRESFYVLHLNVRNRVIGVEEVAKGHLGGVEVHPREVFKGALLGNATSMIIAHNHPSGVSTPSREDIVLTERLVQAGRLLGVPILDHIVVTDKDCTSMRDKGFAFGRARRR
jgi:DNA repair protein RadC